MGMSTLLFDHLTEPDRRAVLSVIRRRRFKRGEVVFHEGDPGDSIHFVSSGHISIKITTPLGEIATIRVVGPGDFFGELALLDAGPRSATAAAIESAETLALHKSHFDDLRARSPKIDLLLLEALSLEVRRLADANVEALYLPADKRLWRRLLSLIDSYGQQGGPASIPVTQEELAQLAGVTRPTANRILRDGEDAGALRLARGRIEVLDHGWVSKRAH